MQKKSLRKNSRYSIIRTKLFHKNNHTNSTSSNKTYISTWVIRKNASSHPIYSIMILVKSSWARVHSHIHKNWNEFDRFYKNYFLKDSNFTNEHLILLMQIMDTNISLIEESAEFEWTYLNGYSSVVTIENIQKYFNEYCNKIKVYKCLLVK